MTRVAAHRGRILLAQRGRPHVLEISDAGPTEYGRGGEGPGEFRSAYWVGLVGDTVWGIDSRLYRVNLFAPEAEPRTLELGPRGLLYAPMAYFGQGLSGGTAIAGPGEQQVVWVVTVLNERVDTVGRLGASRSIEVRAGSATMRMRDPLDDSGLIGFDVANARIVIGDRRASADEFTLVWIDARGGDTLMLRRYPVERRRVTDEVVDNLIEMQRRFLSVPLNRAGATPEGFRREMRQAIGARRWLPPATDLVVGGSGEVWIRGPEVEPGRPARWTVIARSGEVAATFDLVADRRIVAADGSDAWVIDPEENLYRYRLIPAAAVRR